ncbi:ATP-dependent endonuclease [Paenibacillus sp. NPDC058071]|uniref:ATP-dependent nuclease n=1 Tax=Paenibacillus sp. NPDC058071 TaxID=3346326 RepID=UPI0036DD0C90
MYISTLKITGYKNSREKSMLMLNKGLNVLVGENGSGKTTIINALRLALKEHEFSYMNISEDDFYRSLDKKYLAPEMRIDLTFDSLSPDEKVTFLTWCDAEFKAQLHLEVSSNPNRKGYYKKDVWGGSSKSSAFEEETFDCIDCIYLPPLRDAEEKLVNGKKSRLAQLLRKQYGDEKDELVKSVEDFNKQITNNVESKYNQIEVAKSNINMKLEETLGQRFGQTINLQFSESTFNKIVESIKMVFFPGIKQKDPEKFRDIATNSLGYNNLLYIATVFAELELLKENNMMTVLLIEEPEAHLHPQLQIKFIKHLEEITEKSENLQVIVTTHSPVLASSIDIDRLIHVTQQEGKIDTISVKNIDLGNSRRYINRWMDVTKSTLLFSKGVILVEGISEAMIIPSFAKIVLAKYNKNALSSAKSMLPNSLEEAGISTINISGINFKHFLKLFANCDSSVGEEHLPIYCSGITDNDPPKEEIIVDDKDGKSVTKKVEVYPKRSDTPLGENSAITLISEIESSKWGRLFVSPLKTFEYDLLMEGNISVMAKVLQNAWPSDKGSVSSTCKVIVDSKDEYADDNAQVEDAKYIFEHIESKELGKGIYAQELTYYLETEMRNIENNNDLEDLDKLIKISDLFKVPNYISRAILWSCGGVEIDE